MFQWKQLPNLPDREGFAAPFAGMSGNALVVAGGANFPDKRPWEGGTKIWYDKVFVLPAPYETWSITGKLPRPLGYGISVTTSDGVLCAGGGDAKQHYADVFLLRRNGSSVECVTSGWPAMPRPCAFMSGALVGTTFYVSGGIETPDATACMNTFWALDVARPEQGWRELDPCPGGARMLAVAGAGGDSFYLFSGTRLSAGKDGKAAREYLKDAWRFTPGSGWKRLADMPRAAVASASPAPEWDGGQLMVVSGDDGSLVGFKPETEHPGFPRSVLGYDPRKDVWTEYPGCPLSRATVPTVEWNGRTVIPAGEARPGYRSAEVWVLSPRKKGGDR